MKFKEYIEEAKEDNLIQKIKNAKDRKELNIVRDLVASMSLKDNLKKKVHGVMKIKYNEFAKKKK